MSLCLAGSVRADGGFPGFDVGNPITVFRPPYAVHGSRQGDAKIRDVQPFAGGLDRCIGLPGRDGGAVQAVQGEGDTLGFRGLEVVPKDFFIRLVDGVYSRARRFVRGDARSVHARSVKQRRAGVDGGSKPCGTAGRRPQSADVLGFPTGRAFEQSGEAGSADQNRFLDIHRSASMLRGAMLLKSSWSSHSK